MGKSICCFALTAASLTAFGEADLHWADDAGGSTATNSNWQENTAPAAGDNLHFDLSATAVRKITVGANDGTQTAFGAITSAYDYPFFYFDLENKTLQLGNAGGFGGFLMATKPATVIRPAGGVTPTTIGTLRAPFFAKLETPAASDRLVVSNFNWGANINKTGSGTLSIVNPPQERLRVTVAEGTLELDTPQDDGELVGDPYVHVDASVPGTLEFTDVNGTNCVKTWKDVRGDAYPRFQQHATYTAIPFLRTDAALYPHPVVDFGALAMETSSVTGEVARLGHPSSLALYPQCATGREFFAVVADTDKAYIDGTENRGRQPFVFGNGSYTFHTYGDGLIFNSGNVCAKAGDIRVNDVGEDTATTLHGPDLKVLSVGTTAAARLEYIARDRDNIRVGGLRFAEVVVYTNTLTRAERSKVNRYLMKKWVKAAREKPFQVDEVSPASGAAISVPAGKTASVRRIVAKGAAFTKTGAGTLAIGCVEGDQPANITVAAGAVSVLGRDAPSADPQPAAHPYVHFDADAADTLTATEENGTNYVTRWGDANADSTSYAMADATHRPWIVENACNGRRVLDFGTYTNAGPNPYMTIYAKPGIKALGYWFQEMFAVYRCNTVPTGNYSPFILGGTGYEGWHWGDNGTLMTTTGGNNGYYGAKWNVDGRNVAPNTRVSREFHVVNAVLDQPMRDKYYLMNDRGNIRTGGAQLAEFIGYNRRLTDAERRDTQAYLMKKWLGLPHPDESAPVLGSISYPASVDPVIDTDATNVVQTIDASGVITKTGAGKLTVKGSADATGFAAKGGVFVHENTFAAKAAFHIDAADRTSYATYVENGTNFVSRVNDASGGSVYAVTNNGFYGPHILENAGGSGLPAFDFGPYVLGEDKAAIAIPRAAATRSGSLFWNKSINVQELFLVLGDHADEHKQAFFIGKDMSWHRGNSGALFCGFAADNIEQGLLHLNGAVVTENAVLANGLNVVGVSITNGNAVTANAWANDRTNIRIGGVVIAEALVYDTALTPAERENTLLNLAIKWQGVVAASQTRDVLSAAAGSRLELPNQLVSVATVSGAGAIAADYLEVTGTLAPGDADAATAGTLSLELAKRGLVLKNGAQVAVDVDSTGAWDAVAVTGAVKLEGAGTIALDAPAGIRLAKGVYPVITATGGVTAVTPGAWRVTGSVTERYAARVVVTADAVSVKIASMGSVMTFR